MVSRDYEYLLELIRAALCGEKAKKKPEDISWDAVFKAADRHGVLLLAFESALCSGEALDKACPQYWKERYTKLLARSMNQGYEIGRLSTLFENEHIPYVLLKGSRLRQEYPQPELREMCDLDILIPCDKERAAMEIAAKSGYELQSELTTSHNTEWFKPPYLVLELHTFLVPKDSEFFPYYHNIWERTERREASYEHVLSIEEQYIFMIVHMQKHYFMSGTGIRSIVDVFVFLQKYGDRMDRDYIQKAFARLGVADFARDAEMLAEYWFGDTKPELSPEQRKMQHRILTGATYGTSEQQKSNTLMKQMKDNGGIRAAKSRIFFGKIFPDRDFMAGWFPWVRKCRLLMPTAWLARWCCILVKKPQALKQHYRYVKGLQLMQDEITEK